MKQKSSFRLGSFIAWSFLMEDGCFIGNGLKKGDNYYVTR